LQFSECRVSDTLKGWMTGDRERESGALSSPAPERGSGQFT